jgi:hypothetical protein
MGSEMQPGVMKAQKREILISHVKKILYLVYKKLLSVWNWKSFLQTYSKLVISFMNRKSSCGYATHFFKYKNTAHARIHSCYTKLVSFYLYFV